MNEMHFSITSLLNDSLLFVTKDVDSNKPVLATIIVTLENGESPLSLFTDSLGKAMFSNKANIRQLSISSIGYRNLTVNISKIKGL
jgi:hypothetical protein